LRLVDVHCHLESEVYTGSLDRVVADAARAGVRKMITSSIEPGQWDLSESIASRFEEVEFALGIHPWYCAPGDIERIPALAEAKNRGAVAIGEIGLDKKSPLRPMELQQAVFGEQLKIARDIDLPVIIHCRGAFEELRDFLKKTGAPKAGGILHTFSGSVEIAEEFMKYGLSFSFGGVLTYRNSRKKREVLKKIYPERMLLETDSPDIPPVEARGVPNVPANILHVLRAAAELLDVPEEEIAETTTRNASRIFKLAV